MTYRAPLFRSSGETLEIDSDVLSLLSDAQLAQLAMLSLQLGQPVEQLLRTMRPIAEQEGGSTAVSLLGILPHCGLYGCLHSSGTFHT